MDDTTRLAFHLIGLLLAIVGAIWVYSDAKKRGRNGVAWAVGVFFALIIFLPLWLILRPRLSIETEQERPRPRSYPGFLQAIGILALLTLLGLVLGGIVHLVDLTVDVSLCEHPASIAAVSAIGTGLILMYGLRKTRARFKEVFRFVPVHVRLLLPMTVMIVGATILASELSNLICHILPVPEFRVKEMYALVSGRTSLWGSILAIVIVIPVAEELLFRGLILRGFLRRYSMTKAVILSAVLFSAFHLDLWQVPATSIAGLILGWWFVRTRSILPCIFGHALNNALALVTTYVFYPDMSVVMKEVAEAPFQPLWLDLTGLLLMGLGIWLLLRMFRREQTMDLVSGPQKIMYDRKIEQDLF